MERISEHISYREAVKSNTAMRLDIDNTPEPYEISNMHGVAANIFEPLREWVGGPIKISSFFRCTDLNRAIGGSNRSQHCQGRAIDIDDTYRFKTNAEMFKYIKNNLDFDQIIWEFGTEKNPDWVHISYISNNENRGKCLKARRMNGRAVYSII